MLFALAIPMSALAAYLNLRGKFPPGVVLLGTLIFTACLLQAFRLFAIRAHLRQTGRKPRGGWASLALAGVSVAILLSAYRPLSDIEQRICFRAVTVAIVAQRDSDDASTAPTLRLLAREQGIRYAVRDPIEEAAAAVRVQQRHERPSESAKRVADASKRLQRNCGYRRPPF